MRPLAPAPPSTVCKRSPSPSTICTRKAWSAMKPPWRTPAIRTTSSSKCRASIQQQMLRVSRWSKPDLAPEERKLNLKSTTKEIPTGDANDRASPFFSIFSDQVPSLFYQRKIFLAFRSPDHPITGSTDVFHHARPHYIPCRQLDRVC